MDARTGPRHKQELGHLLTGELERQKITADAHELAIERRVHGISRFVGLPHHLLAFGLPHRSRCSPFNFRGDDIAACPLVNSIPRDLRSRTDVISATAWSVPA
jgi:hypothetical protein